MQNIFEGKVEELIYLGDHIRVRLMYVEIMNLLLKYQMKDLLTIMRETLLNLTGILMI